MTTNSPSQSVATQPPAAGEAAHTHTPTPWQAMPSGRIVHEYVPEGCRAIQCTSVAEALSGFGQPTKANAAFIVRACNSHAALVAALSRCAQQLELVRPLGDGLTAQVCISVLNEAQAALSAARA